MHNTQKHFTIWVRNEDVPINLEYLKAKVEIIEKFFHIGHIWVIHYSSDKEITDRTIDLSHMKGGATGIYKDPTKNLKKDIANVKSKFYKMLADNEATKEKINKLVQKHNEAALKNQANYDKAINQINEYLKTIEPDPTTMPT